MKRLMLLCLLWIISGVSLSTAQTTTNSDATISFPPPVYVVRGEFEVRGSADVPNMSNYFLEFRPLNDDLTAQGDDIAWIPATLPNSAPITDGVLGVWNTETAEDGLYELRLTVNVARSAPVYFVVSPLRVENELPPFVTLEATPTPNQLVRATATRASLSRPTLAATPTAFDASPRVTAITDANVRAGDSVAYERIGVLLTGESAPILGRSAIGSGWFYIQLDTGRRGFIAPSTVTVTGNIENLQLITPPPTPTPTFTPTPPANGNLIINGGQTVPTRPDCGTAFSVQLNVTNIGTRSTLAGATVLVQDFDVATGAQTTIATGTIPVLNPGDNFVVVIPLTVSSYPARDHQITATVDSLSQLIEENEGDNSFSFVYRLRQGGCP
ncbi:MAG: hypothetical protein MUF87_19450 [Anaerolineae bacterium]|jgi:uncharacterized protein YgiM (DUF1202 family)|nr:hypothetical protein [Anaerolineae bacterium]